MVFDFTTSSSSFVHSSQLGFKAAESAVVNAKYVTTKPKFQKDCANRKVTIIDS